ncbi:ABC transporter permease [Rhizobium puerariae]|uniref:ABC transporter permease n=1 Tax=Rhizobium puerariae TaxID=1585791 RepID=A0ABV6AJK2_9HYPH
MTDILDTPTIRSPRIGPTLLLAGSGTAILIAVALFGPLIAPHDPLQSNVQNALATPDWRHWAGTDQVGRDVLSRLLVATRLDIFIAVVSVLLSFAIGAVIGAFAGYLGGWPDRLVSRAVDMLMAFPLFVLAMALIAVVGTGVMNIVYATALINLPFYIRVARAEVNARRGAGWVEAARLAGNGHVRIILLLILPNVLPVIMVQISINLGWAILNAAALSFLGLGVQPPTPEWGIMVADGAQYITSGKWWLVAFPGLALMFAVFCFNLLGDALRDVFDPRKRR